MSGAFSQTQTVWVNEKAADLQADLQRKEAESKSRLAKNLTEATIREWERKNKGKQNGGGRRKMSKLKHSKKNKKKTNKRRALYNLIY